MNFISVPLYWEMVIQGIDTEAAESPNKEISCPWDNKEESKPTYSILQNTMERSKTSEEQIKL